MARSAALAGFSLSLLGPGSAAATPPTPGYPEAVVQWGVQKGETCEDIAKALYGSPKYAPLLQRYNHVACKAGAPLREGLTLVVPEKPTTLPDARLRSMNPDVRARPGGGGWAPAATGMPLFSNSNVNTLDRGRADVEFIDRTRVFLAPNTLVVIYGTASQTSVSKSAPVAVEVESGEVKTGLAALRGSGVDVRVEVGVKGGGRVSAASRDTVVQRKGERTTVEVFDGKAGVTSGGKSVDVPTNFGTRFVGVKPPAPPRPLPPAPIWAQGGSGATVLAPGGVGTITATWAPVPGAINYRVELEREDKSEDPPRKLVVRDEVPASVTSFRGELKLGTYSLTVRAIDKEEYLGIASTPRVTHVLDARIESGSGAVGGGEIEANPYGVLRFAPSPQMEMALDDGAFGPMLDVIDLRRSAPHALRLRPRGSTDVESIPIRYTKVGATPSASAAPGGGALNLRVKLTGLQGIDVPVRVRPKARVHLPEGVRDVALTAGPDGVYVGSLAVAGPIPSVRVDVTDDRGMVLGTSDPPPSAAPAAPPAPARVRYPLLGAYAPLWQASPAADVIWFAPTPHDGAAVSVGTVRSQGRWTFQGQVRASGAVGPLGLEAALRSNTTDDKTADATAWLGARWRVLRLEGAALEVAPAMRVGFPASSAGAPAQLEPAVALGGAAGRFTWVVDAGGRLRLGADHGMTGVPTGQAFILAGGTLDPIAWLRLDAALDAHLVVRDTGAKNALGGLGVGVEAGGAVYGGLALHLSPLPDPGVGVFTAQLALGLRGAP